MKSASCGSERSCGIDALRGSAVLLMIEQHLGVWLWQDQHRLFHDPLMLCINGLGGLAGPLFIMLAGFGAVLLPQRHASSSRVLAARGLLITAAGYSLNLLAPSWFSPGSWYVLHMIGFGLVVSPLLMRLPDAALIISFGAVLVISLCLQNMLDTPFSLSNSRMSDTALEGGVLRLAAVEGHFPVFPWLGVFISGMLMGRWYRKNQLLPIGVYGAACITAGFCLAGCHLSGLAFATDDQFSRACRLLPRFYPALTPIVLLLNGTACCLSAFFIRMEDKWKITAAHALVCLGRTSLTFFLVHILLFREAGRLLGWWKTFSKVETLLLTAAVLLCTMLAARLWQKVNFVFSAEWLLRKAVG